jgi:hypothetical protein
MKSLIFLVLVTIISGCANSGKINNVRLGMTKDEVIKVLGEPVSITAQDDNKFLNYKLSETNNDALRGLTTPYYVKIMNDRVESFGRSADIVNSEKPAVDDTKIENSSKQPGVRIQSHEECAQGTAAKTQKDEEVKTEIKSEPELYTQLKKLKELREEGALTEKEYQERKKKILITQLGSNFINFFAVAAEKNDN